MKLLKSSDTCKIKGTQNFIPLFTCPIYNAAENKRTWTLDKMLELKDALIPNVLFYLLT